MNDDGMSERPKLRPVEVIPVEMDGQNMYALRDTSSDAEDVVVITPQFFFIVSLCDGENSLRDIQLAFTRRFGLLIQLDEVKELIQMIDEKLLLDSPRYEQHLGSLRKTYLDLPVRPAVHANRSYSGDPRELDLMLGSFFHVERGPGDFDDSLNGPIPSGLVVPHIDFNRGGPIYAHGYRHLAEAEDCDVFVILGTDHDLTTNFYSLSSKPYSTPFGDVALEQSMIDSLIDRVDFDPFADEFNQRREHSIEFQVVFLSWLYRSRKPFTIVPVLCGSYYEMIHRGHRPELEEQICQFTDALGTLIEKSDKKICVIASVDFSHVGIQFGAANGVTASDLEEITLEDRVLIDSITGGDREAFIDRIYASQNKFNVCGVSPLNTLMTVFPNRPGKLLSYDFWQERDAGSMVSFASIVIP